MQDTNTLTHDTPLASGGAQGEQNFMHDLRVILNSYGVDNACGTPDYILADLLREHLRTWRFYATARDLHAGYPSSLNTEQGARVVNTHLGSLLVPLQGNPNLSKEQSELLGDKLCYPPHPNCVYPTLGRQVTDYHDGDKELTHLEIDPTKLSDAEKARILHAYDWSDDAPDNALQRAGRQLMVEAEERGEIHRPGGVEGGASCSQ